MRFAQSEYLVLILILPLIGIFYFIVFKLKSRAISRFGDSVLMRQLTSLVSKGKQVLKALFIIAAIFCLILSLARPQWGSVLTEYHRKGLDIFIAIDTSKSMLAEDIKPSRIMEAKRKLQVFIDGLKGDRIGLIPFAGKAYVLCPLTLDYGAAKLFLETIDVGIVPVPGTNLASAIEIATSSFVRSERKYKVLILLTDGENLQGDPIEAAKKAAKEGVKIYTIGIGTKRGEPIPIYSEQGVQIGYKKDKNQEPIISALDDVTLQKIALLTDGAYYFASPQGSDLGKIFKEIESMEKKELRSKKMIKYEERYQYFLIVAILLLFMEAIITDKKKNSGGLIRYEA